LALDALIERTLAGLGYELVDLESSGGRARLLRVFIDREGGIQIADCERVSRHLTQLFAAERVEYGRLEVSSPGLDRRLRNEAALRRFRGEPARVRLRVPLAGRRNFVGQLGEVRDGRVELEVDGQTLAFELTNLAAARLVPRIQAR
jgi:ribosome maturation factor RimP